MAWLLQEYGRRDSRGRPLDLIDLGPRRSSFQGMCDTAVSSSRQLGHSVL